MKALKSIKNYIVAAGLLLCGYGTVQAQVQDYTYSQSFGTYNAISGGTVLKSGTGSYRQIFNNVAIGFTFNYNGTRADIMSIHGNGFLAIGNTATSYNNGAYVFADANATGNNHIVPFAGTTDKWGTLGTAEVRVETLGSAPNRRCVIQWKDLAIYNNGNPTITNLNFQCILYETTNVIEFVYGACTKTSTSTPYDYAFIGLKGNNSLDINARETNRTPQIIDNTFPSTSIYPYCYVAIPPTFPQITLPTNGLTMKWMPPPSFDFKMIGFIAPFSPCGNASDTIKVRIKSNGLDSTGPSTVTVSVKLKGAINTTFSTVITDPILGKSEFNVPVGVINTYNLSDTIRYEMSVTHGSDGTRTNDSMVRVISYFTPTQTVTVPDKNRCGFGTVTLAPTSIGSNETVLWYNNAASTIPVASGPSYTTPILTPSSTPYTYYVERVQQTPSMTISTPNATNWGFGGSSMGYYMDITADVADMMIESFVISRWNQNKVTDAAVYIKSGTYVGFERNAAAWTLSAQRFAFSSTGTVTIPAGNFVVPKGSTMGVYIIYSNTLPTPITNASPVTDNRITLTKDGVWKVHSSATGPFTGGAINTTYGYDGAVVYRAVCKSSKTSVNVTVNPRPVGANIVQSTPFEGDFRTGIQANPDITKAGDDLAYEIATPTGFTNAGHGTTWNMNISLKTLNGTTVPTADYVVTNPSSSGNGKIVITPSSPFTDSILRMTVSVVNAATSCDTSYIRHIFVAPVPNADFTANDVCLGTELLFANNTTLSSGTMTYAWDFGDTLGTSTDPAPAYRYTKPGSYTVKLTVTSNLGYTSTVSKVVNVKTLPVANFNRVSACLGDSVAFTNTSTNSGSFTSLWSFGDATTSNALNPKHKYAAVGSYNVKLTVTSANGCASVIQKSVSTFHKPVAAYASSGNCNSSDVVFTNNSTLGSGNMGYVWDFQDGTKSYEANPTHRFASTGVKNVKLKVVSEFGCSDSVTQTFNIAGGPSASFNASEGCSVDSTAFRNTSTTIAGGTSYLWDFGDGFTSTEQHPKHKYASLGNKTVTLTVTATANNCVSISKQDLNIRIQPKAAFSVKNVCDGEAVDFINTSTISNGADLTYKWLFDDGQQSSAVSPSHVYATPNTYNAKLVVNTDGGCADTMARNVKVSAIPACNFTFSIDKGTRTVTFNGPSTSGITYQWLFGDGGRANGSSTSYQYLFNGSFDVKLIATNADGCSCESSQAVVIQQLGVKPVGKLGREVNMYPNPTSGVVTITLSGTSNRAVQLSVINMVGAAVRSGEIAPEQFSGYTLDMSDLPAGVYMVKLQDGNQSTAQRITITR